MNGRHKHPYPDWLEPGAPRTADRRATDYAIGVGTRKYERTKDRCMAISLPNVLRWSRGGLYVSLLASHQGELGSIPGRATPGFTHNGIVPDDAGGRRIFSGVSRFLPVKVIPALFHTYLASPSSALKTSLPMTYTACIRIADYCSYAFFARPGIMGLLVKLVVLLVAILVGYLYMSLTAVPPVPKLESKWWGRGQPQRVDQSIRPFKINIPQKALNDLKQRLKQVPDLTPPLEGIGFEYGFNSKYLQDVVQYWRDKYDWRQRENFLNSLPQFKTYVDGLDMHFIHVKPKNVPANTRVLPLLLLHGWPGSIREFYSIIPLLTTPRSGVDFVFEVVAPSLPGYGFSEGAAKPGLGTARTTVVIKNLMDRLGHDRFYVQGGDWGSFIASTMAAMYKDNRSVAPSLGNTDQVLRRGRRGGRRRNPSSSSSRSADRSAEARHRHAIPHCRAVVGVHLNFCFVETALSNLKWVLGSLWPTLIVDKEYVGRMYPVGAKFTNILKESGYMHIQATKPDTVAMALRDSPVGLAAYILEKFSTWTNPEWESRPDGGLTAKYKLDDLLDNIMIYWLSGSITTSVRLYSEHFGKENREWD
ncbi:hypothetical protein PR048_021918 [Dryococelus australis]|uniref:Epoxide hydrolase N-terminal domain-containing protein n=1 Tax=Dryococelus australis TaxID=614101 RepID=A0ABQ9GZR8_9NEOP|nr:hypothetical protein PR048_021918 [Dryococelus australis]